MGMSGPLRLGALALLAFAVPAQAGSRRSGEAPPPVVSNSPGTPVAVPVLAAPIDPRTAVAKPVTAVVVDAAQAAAVAAPLTPSTAKPETADGVSPAPSGQDLDRVQASAGWRFDKTRPLDVVGPGVAAAPVIAPPTLAPAQRLARPERGEPRGAQVRGPPSSAWETVGAAQKQGLLSAPQAAAWLSAAYADVMTGLPNRVYIEEHLERLVAGKGALVTFKLDWLKEINDGYSHEAGNRALRAVAVVARTVAGSRHSLVRRSPTGFAVFYDGDEAQARLFAQALRGAVAARLGSLSEVLPSAAGGAVAGTISVGVAALPQRGDASSAYEAALAEAERAREFAKDQGGGDRVAVEDEGPRLLDRLSPGELSSRLSAQPDGQAIARRLAVSRRVSLGLGSSPKQPPLAAMLAGIPAAAREALFALVYRDRLTGLRNRRWLTDHLGELFKPGGAAHYLALDIDHFGLVNKVVGEQRADLVLQELGGLIGEAAEARGAVALHLSGEEFSLLAGPDVDAQALAEAVRRLIENDLGARVAKRHGLVDPATGRPLRLTVSVGLARVAPAGEPRAVLALAHAAAESQLQRAKDGGRNRVGSDQRPLSAVTSVRAWAARLVAAARRAAAAPASSEFDDSFQTRAEVLRRLGFNPAAQQGDVLSDPVKLTSWVARIKPKGGPARVVKIAPERTIQNEVFIRGVIDSFELLNESLRAPRAVAYRRPLLKSVMVMEDVEQRDARRDARHLPLRHKAALAMLALTFGVHDVNGKSFVDVNWRRSVLLDFERARDETTAGSPARIAGISELPWVSPFYLNDFADYVPMLTRWDAAYARPSTRDEMVALLRRVGVPETGVKEDLALFERNLRRLPQVLRADIAYANRVFNSDAAHAGLSPTQTRALSMINRAAHSSPEGGAARDVLR